jgi:hypothetical protein
MRFNYNPNTEELSAYVNKNDFDFAANKDSEEYRIFSRDFKKTSLINFIQEFSKFVCHIFSCIYPEEKIKDIIVVSKFGKGFSWTSLLNLNFNDNTLGFFENLINYGMHALKEHNKDKNFMEKMPKEEVAKLSLINHLVATLNCPEPWQRKRKTQENQINIKIKDLKKSIKSYENKFGFSSEEMLKYYADDEMPEEEMIHWKNAFFELKNYENILKKQDSLEKIIQIWMES